MGMRRSHRVVAALAIASVASVACVALGACNLLTGLDADYSANAHDGAPAAVVDDGGGGDGPGSDGQMGADGSTTDGMVKPDSPLGSTFCQNAKDGSADEDFFCTDFESESFPGDGAAPAPWASMTNLRDAGTITFVQANGSRVLDVTGVTSGGNPAGTYLEVALAQTKQANLFPRYRLEFDIHVLDSNLDYDAYGLLVFKPHDGTGENGLAGYGPNQPHELSHQGTGSSPMLYVSNAPPTQWWHAVITLTQVDGGAYTRTITLGANSVDDNPTGHIIPLSAPTQLWMGVFNADAVTGSGHAQFDNVTLRRTP